MTTKLDPASKLKVLRIQARAKADGGNYDFVKSEEVPKGEVWHITTCSFENETGARGTVRVYIGELGYDHWLWEQTSPAKGTLYKWDDDFTLNEGEKLVARQASCVADDQLQLLAIGYIEPVG